MPRKDNQGKLISFEGIDGSGKSSALLRACTFLKKTGIPVLTLRQPGGTKLGEELRNILKHHSEPLDPITEVLLLGASFREAWKSIILPALDKGTWVLCDRFTDSTLAYQCGGCGLNESVVKRILGAACPLSPDKTFYYDISAHKALKRVASRGSLDNFEKKGEAHQENIRKKYLELSKENPRRITVIDTEIFNEQETGLLTIAELQNVLEKTA